MLGQRRALHYPHSDWVTTGVTIATVATILAGASVTGFILFSQAQLQTVPAEARTPVRAFAAIYSVASLCAYGATLANALATIFDLDDATRYHHVRSAAKFFLTQGIMIAVFAALVILTFGLPLQGASERDKNSSIERLPTEESSGLSESTRDDYCPVSGHE